MQIAHIKGGLMADTIVPVPDGVGIFDRNLPGKKETRAAEAQYKRLQETIA